MNISFIGGGIMAEAMRQDGFRVEELIAVGGGSTSKLWLQIVTDILDVPIVSTESAYVAAFGAALIAAEEMDIECNPDLLVVRDRFYPSDESSELYSDKRERFESVYHSLSIPD